MRAHQEAELRGALLNAVVEGVHALVLDRPELSHCIDDTPHPRGEIAVRTPQLFRGYDGLDASKSCVVIEGERFYCTGDLGEARVGNEKDPVIFEK